jgi:hypothetical protein
MKHAYQAACECARCNRERVRRERQARTVPEVMNDWTRSRNRRRARVAREYWDAYESGRPMSSDDY